MQTDILTLRELALHLKTAEQTLYRFVGKGKVPGFGVGSTFIFRKIEIDKWIKKQGKIAIAKETVS